MLNKKTIIFITLGVILAIFVLARGTVFPFVLGAGFAYIFNPIIRFITRKTHIRRFWAIIIFFVIVVSLIVYFSTLFIFQLIREFGQLEKEVGNIASFSQESIKSLPVWTFAGQDYSLQSVVVSSLSSLSKTLSHIQSSTVPIFTGAFGYLIKVLVFIVALFYFLKDGHLMIEKVLRQLPESYEAEIREIGKRLNVVLGGYLRGQLLLVLIMSSASSLILIILGIKYAIVLGLLTGFLELIPFVGPIIATVLVAALAFFTGTNNFGFDPIFLATLVVIIYFTLRQLEDYFVMPQVLGRLMRLHPLLVIFSTLVGGAIAGPVGLIIGVPVVACSRVLLEYFWERSF